MLRVQQSNLKKSKYIFVFLIEYVYTIYIQIYQIHLLKYLLYKLIPICSEMGKIILKKYLNFKILKTLSKSIVFFLNTYF